MRATPTAPPIHRGSFRSPPPSATRRSALRRLGRLAVNNVQQEHGTVLVDDAAWFDRLPVGSLVRVLPNHACITAAGYGGYDVVRGGAVVARWERVNGW